MKKNKQEKTGDPLTDMVNYLSEVYSLGVEDAAQYVIASFLSDANLKSRLEGILSLYSSERNEEKLQAHEEFQELLNEIKADLDNKA